MPSVLITGANRGLGLALTRQFLDRDWFVTAVSRRSSDELDALAANGKLENRVLDLTDDGALQALAQSLEGRTLDVLLNNAGTMGRKSFAESGLKAGRFGSFDRQEWHDVFDINVFTPMRLAELLVENLAASENGRVATLTSIVGSMALNTAGGMYGYRASKAAVNAIMKSLAIDLGKRGIIAVALHPGFVRTDMSGPMAEIDPDESAAGMIAVIGELTLQQAGKVIAWNGDVLPW